MLPVQRHGRLLSAAIKTILGAAAYSMLASAAIAQETTSAAQLDEVVVTGYRASLAEAIDVKRNETAIVDVIKSEDIAKFPDLNLAESLQRIPGVSIDRDGGEGRTIVIRGLGPEFTRVRLNGLEALATSGGKDNSGGANRGRSFDFNIFASDLFNSITVRKAQSAEVEEGSLGATVDLATAHPFDYNEFTLTFAGQAAYSDLTQEATPRGTFLISDTWLDRRLGALLSVAYTERKILEEGSSTVRWESPAVTGNTSGNFQAPVPTGVGAAWHPRIPRYGRTQYDQDRLGVTFALQALPWQDAQLTLDVLYAELNGTRQEEYLEVISFSRAGQGLPQTDVVSAIIDEDNNLIAGTFNDVDMRTEQRIDELSTTFKQFSLSLQQKIGDRIDLNATIGTSESAQDNPVQTTLSIERYDSDGYSYDYRGNQRLPRLEYGGVDVTNPSSFTYSSSAALGDASLVRMRPNETTNSFDIGSIDVAFELNDTFTVKGGVLYKSYEFETVEARRSTENAPAALNNISLTGLTQLVTGFGRNMNIPGATPTSWVVPSIDAFNNAYGIYCNCVNAYGDFRVSVANRLADNRSVSEDDSGVFVQLDFRTQIGDMPFRGNVGARYVMTDLSSTGYTGTTQVTVDNDYDDFLPSLNVVLELTDELFLRGGASKTMSRPNLTALTPGGTVSNGADTATIGNPLLEPLRANTVDLSLEWYPGEGALVSLGLFYKDLTSYIQRSQRQIPYSETGLPDSLLGSGNTPDTIFTVTQDFNTEGGDLQGVEIGLQQPFTFLPAPFDGFGGILNYTYVKSDIRYIVTPSLDPNVYRDTVEPLVNLSPTSWNATLYFENERFSIRGTAAYRDDYLRLVPGGSGADVSGKFATLNVDLSASVTLTEHFELTFEAINLTDEYDDRWQSRARQNSESYEHTGRQFFAGFRAKL